MLWFQTDSSGDLYKVHGRLFQSEKTKELKKLFLQTVNFIVDFALLNQNKDFLEDHN